MAPPKTAMETIAYSMWGTSFFLDVGYMIPQVPVKDIQYLAEFNGPLIVVIFIKSNYSFLSIMPMPQGFPHCQPHPQRLVGASVFL